MLPFKRTKLVGVSAEGSENLNRLATNCGSLMINYWNFGTLEAIPDQHGSDILP